MKILKHGSIIITEDDIVVTGFDVDGEGGLIHGFEIWALIWALHRLISKLFPMVNK